MKGLAWYTAVILAITHIMLFIVIITSTDMYSVGFSVWAMAVNTPILLFSILYLTKNRKRSVT